METGDEFSRYTDARGTRMQTCPAGSGVEDGGRDTTRVQEVLVDAIGPDGVSLLPFTPQGKGWGQSQVNLWWGTPAWSEKMLFFPTPPRNLLSSPQEQRPFSRAKGGAPCAELMSTQGPRGKERTVISAFEFLMGVGGEGGHLGQLGIWDRTDKFHSYTMTSGGFSANN